MSLMSNILHGFKQSFKFKRVSGYIMLIQFGLSMLVALLTIKYVNSSIGNSTNLMKIIEGYNHDVFQDLLRFESTGWSMIKSLIALTVGIYLFIGPMISGGLLNAFHKGIDQWNIFWSGGSRFYFPFLKLNLLVAFFLAIVSGVLGALAMAFSTYGLANFVSEIPVLIGIFVSIFILILVIIYLVSISAKAKWNMIEKEDTAVWKNFRAGMKGLKNKKTYYLVLGIVFLLFSLVFAFFTNTLINCISETSFMMMLLAFLIQVLVLFFRVFLRNAYQASLVSKA